MSIPDSALVLKMARGVVQGAMTQTPASLATWNRGDGILTTVLIAGVTWRWYGTGYTVPAGRVSVPVTATGGGVWVQDALTVVIPGFIANRPDLPRFCMFYWDNSNWILGVPSSHAKTQNTAVAMTDQDYNLIRAGNPVRFAGSGLTVNQLYKVENPATTGATNLAAYTLPVPDAVLTNIGKSFMPVGKLLDIGAGPYLDFTWRPVVPDGAIGSVSMGIAGLTYNATPTAAQITRVIDANGSGGSDGPYNYVLAADGDANTGSGFAASPVQALVGGVQKGVFLHQMAYGGKHAGYAPGIPVLQEFYARMLFQHENNITRLGLIFGASATAFTALMMDGSPYNMSLEQLAVTAANTYTVTQVPGVQGVNIAPAAIASKTLAFLEVQHKVVGGVSVIKARVYAYDTSKGITPAGLLQQGGNVPTWTVNYTHGSAFPAGRFGYEYNQDHLHLHSLLVSADPDVAPPYAVS